MVFLNRLLRSLKAFCIKYPFQRKVLIMPSYQAGNELRDELARQTGGFMNLCTETVDGLARRAAAVKIARIRPSLLSSGEAAAIFENVYRSLERKGALVYFSKKSASDSLISAIAAAILELRSFGITGKSIDAAGFVNPEKGQDIRRLLRTYERYTRRKNYVDPTSFLKGAMKQLADPEDAFYLMPPFLSLNPIEREFINSWIPKERLFVLPAETIPGIKPPSDTPVMLWPDSLVDFKEEESSTGATDVEQLSWLLQPENAPAVQDDGTLTLFHAYGVTNEAREVLRRITAMQVPVDTVTVAYTGSEYVQVFHSLCRRAGIPLTVSEGIPASLTQPGKTLKGVINWIRSDFDATVLRQLLIEGSIDLPPGEGDLFMLLVKRRLRPDKGDVVLPPMETAELLRASGIGWGRERYASMLTAYCTRTGNELAGMDKNNPKYTLLLNSMELAKQLADAMERILAQVPEPDASDSVIFSNLLLGMWLILNRLARVGDEMDQQALDAITGHLVDLFNLTRFSLRFEDALDRLADAADKLRIGASSPKPGALHLVSYRNLHWTGRPNTFVVGLDADSFPGGVSQDPVLLDRERQLLHPELPLGRDRPRVRQYEMLTALCSRRGRLTLSYPSYDVVENRDNLPSSLLLQAFRLLKRDSSLDYSKLQRWLGSPAGYCPVDPGQALDETEWWIGQALVGHLANGPALVPQCYRNVGRGQAALSARQVGTPTEYDGMVVAAGDDLARGRDNLTLSCSRIEHLARCPFAYFLKYVIHLEPPEEVAYEPGRWLDPMERGLLLHELYCKFMKEIVRRKQRVCVASHKNMMYEMADELIARYRMDTPHPSEVVFNREVRDIRDSCDVFLATEESEIESTPVFFEVPFGMPEEKPGSDMGTADPVTIDLGHGVSFPLRGQIDRIDEMGKDIYCIWDYKTGSARGYEDQKYLCKGRQVQHALYAIAAEQILKDRLGGDPRVLSSGYYFPTKRGEGRLVVRPESERSLIADLMGHLFDILKSGAFLATDDGEACGYCDYGEVCGLERAVSRAKALVSDASNSCLDPWRRMKGFV